jgi:ribosomal protein S18 acetylase RimI-like enzyme
MAAFDFALSSNRATRLEPRALLQVIHALELQVEKDNGDAQEFYRRLGFKTLSRLVMSRAVK